MLTKELLIYLNRDGIKKQSHAELVDLCEDLLNRVRTLEERLSKNSTNSSIAPSTFIPGPAANESEFRAMRTETEEKANKMATPRKQRAQGFGRKQQLPVTAEKDLYPLHCSHCQHRFDEPQAHSVCFTAYYQLDLERSDAALGGYIATHTKYSLYAVTCDACHQATRYRPAEILTTEEKVMVKEWQLIGPTLASVITYLKYDMGSTLRKIKRLLLYSKRLSFRC